MGKLKSKLCEYLMLAVVGGACYVFIELLWRGHSHWSMFIVGGVMFAAVGSINELLPWEMPLIQQAVIGAVLITAVELFAGVILNKWLGLGVWDYSSLPFNLWGQISLVFSLLWVALAGVAVILDDWLRYLLFGEERPHYSLLRRK